MNAIATKIKIVNITIHRVEGLNKLCISTDHGTWADAEKRIINIRSTINHDSCDKCDFTVQFENGVTYSGRYDAKALAAAGEYGLAMHIRSNWQFLTGERCPVHLTQDQYDRVIAAYKEITPEVCEGAKGFLATYSLED